jgi:hypothetical protein
MAKSDELSAAWRLTVQSTLWPCARQFGLRAEQDLQCIAASFAGHLLASRHFPLLMRAIRRNDAQGRGNGGVPGKATLVVVSHASLLSGLFLAWFFPQERFFNNFSALFFSLFRFVFHGRACVFNNFSVLFFKMTSFFVPFVPKNQKTSLFPGPQPACRALQILPAARARASPATMKATILAHPSQVNSTPRYKRRSVNWRGSRPGMSRFLASKDWCDHFPPLRGRRQFEPLIRVTSRCSGRSREEVPTRIR